VTIPADAAGSPRFRHDPFTRDVASDPGGAMAPRDCGATHVAFGSHDGLGLHNVVISWLNPTPHAITVYASDPALPRRPQHSLPGGSLGLTRTGLAPVGSRQLRLAHRVATPCQLHRFSSIRAQQLREYSNHLNIMGLWGIHLTGVRDLPPRAALRRSLQAGRMSALSRRLGRNSLWALAHNKVLVTNRSMRDSKLQDPVEQHPSAT
jgi:hypothetical protein